MALWHLDELIVALMAAGWTVSKTHTSNCAGLSGMWDLTWANAKVSVVLEFHRAEEDSDVIVDTDPLELSYGCAVRYNPNVALHFYKKKRYWDEELPGFLEGLDEVAEKEGAEKDKLLRKEAALVKTA